MEKNGVIPPQISAVFETGLCKQNNHYKRFLILWDAFCGCTLMAGGGG